MDPHEPRPTLSRSLGLAPEAAVQPAGKRVFLRTFG